MTLAAVARRGSTHVSKRFAQSSEAAASGGLVGAAPQSDERRQAMPLAQPGQAPPPQSTSVSAPLRRPSEQLAAGPTEEEAEAAAGAVDAEGEAEAAERVVEGVMEGDAPRERLAVGVADGVVDALGEAGSVADTEGVAAALDEGVGVAAEEAETVGVDVGDCGDALGVSDGEAGGVPEGSVECVGLALCVAVVDGVGVSAEDAALATLVAVAPLFVGVRETDCVGVAVSAGEEPPSVDFVGEGVGDDGTTEDTVGVGVDVAAGVALSLPVAVPMTVAAAVGDALSVPLADAASVADAVGDALSVPVSVPDGVAAGVGLSEPVAVATSEAEAVGDGLSVPVSVPVGVAVTGPGLSVPVSDMVADGEADELGDGAREHTTCELTVACDQPAAVEHAAQ